VTDAVYNEIEPYPAEWLRNLIAAGHIAPGRVEERSIVDLGPDDVAGPGQRHFFAGIGVWSHALRLAGWPDDVSVWTGSCPCQPFSAAGKRGGFDDERHLWPDWFRLIRACRPAVVFGEQVASPDGLGWLDAVLADLEGAGYTVGAQDLCAAGVGAPHIRQRLYFMAVADGERLEGIRLHLRERRSLATLPEVGRGGEAGDRTVGDASGEGGGRHTGANDRSEGASAGAGSRPGGVGDVAFATGAVGDVANADQERRGQGRPGRANGDRAIESEGCGDAIGATGGFWHPADWIPCRDGKTRPVEPGTFPLAHGATARVGRLRAYGNAIVAPQAAEVIATAMEWILR
jgi:DNA (cytosine-5)-methyltransferase 1